MAATGGGSTPGGRASRTRVSYTFRYECVGFEEETGVLKAGAENPQSRKDCCGAEAAVGTCYRLMKKYVMLAGCLFGFAVSAGAIDIPRSVHRVSNVAKATEEATKSKKGLLWVLSDSSLEAT